MTELWNPAAYRGAGAAEVRACTPWPRTAMRPARGAIDYRFPAEQAGLAAWQADCSAELIEVLAAADPDHPVRTWGPGGTVRW